MGARDLDLLDAYSRTVTQVAEQVGPSVAAVQVLDGAGRPAGSGSGFLFTADGYLLTNSHVVRAGKPQRPDASRRFHASFSDGRDFMARWVGDDPHTDLALLQVDGLSQGALTPATLGRSAGSRATRTGCGTPAWASGMKIGNAPGAAGTRMSVMVPSGEVVTMLVGSLGLTL